MLDRRCLCCWNFSCQGIGLAEKNVDNLLLLLSFYGFPEHLMNDDEAEKVAKEILELDSNNETAISVLNEILNSKKNK